MKEVHRIRKAILIPLTVAPFSLAAMLILSFFYDSFPGERSLMAAPAVVFSCLLLNFLLREVSFDEAGLSLKTFFKRRYIGWEEVTAAGALVMGSKAYLLLTTRKGFYILTNNYEKFQKILSGIKAHLDEMKVEGEVLRLIDKPLHNYRTVMLAWLTAAVTLSLIALRVIYKL